MTARGVSRLWVGAYALSAIALVMVTYLYWLRAEQGDCLAAQNLATQRRAAAIAAATDAERKADMVLLLGGPGDEQLRAAAVKARVETDKVRAANPAPVFEPCK